MHTGRVVEIVRSQMAVKETELHRYKICHMNDYYHHHPFESIYLFINLYSMYFKRTRVEAIGLSTAAGASSGNTHSGTVSSSLSSADPAANDMISSLGLSQEENDSLYRLDS